MDPVMLDIPEECREVFGLFAMAVVEKPDEFVKAFEILLRHSSDRMLRLLAEKPAADVAYTMLCYLPEDVRDEVAKYMADNPDKRERVLAEVRDCQTTLKAAIQDRIKQGDKPVLELMSRTA